jgi:hypothetical protein
MVAPKSVFGEFVFIKQFVNLNFVMVVLIGKRMLKSFTFAKLFAIILQNSYPLQALIDA